MLKTNKIEILDNGVIQVRVLEVLELLDGTIKNGNFQRYIIVPTDNIEAIECSKVKSVAEVIFTDEVIQFYIDNLKRSDSIL